MARAPKQTEESAEHTFLLLSADGISTEMEIVNQKGNKIVFRIKEAKDPVGVMIKGELITVDLIQLRKAPAGTSQHGVAVERLITLAELAKG